MKKTYEHLENLKKRLEIFEKARNYARAREMRELIQDEERVLSRIESQKPEKP